MIEEWSILNAMPEIVKYITDPNSPFFQFAIDHLGPLTFLLPTAWEAVFHKGVPLRFQSQFQRWA